MLKDKNDYGENWGQRRDPESIVVWLDAYSVDAEFMKILVSSWRLNQTKA